MGSGLTWCHGCDQPVTGYHECPGRTRASTANPLRYSAPMSVHGDLFADMKPALAQGALNADEHLEVFVAPDGKRLCPGCRVTERKESDWIMCHRCVLAVSILAIGLHDLTLPRCARCEKWLGRRPLGNYWCTACWEHVHETGEDEWYPEGATTGNDHPRLLPRPGAIVLAVDDPNGDDVAEG